MSILIVIGFIIIAALHSRDLVINKWWRNGNGSIGGFLLL